MPPTCPWAEGRPITGTCRRDERTTVSSTPIRIDPPTLAERLATGSTVVLEVRTPGEHARSAPAPPTPRSTMPAR